MSRGERNYRGGQRKSSSDRRQGRGTQGGRSNQYSRNSKGEKNKRGGSRKYSDKRDKRKDSEASRGQERQPDWRKKNSSYGKNSNRRRDHRQRRGSGRNYDDHSPRGYRKDREDKPFEWRESSTQSYENAREAFLNQGAGRTDRVEGRLPFLEAVGAGRSVDKVWLQEDLYFNPEIERALDTIKDNGGVVMSVGKAALDRMSDGRNHQGLIAQLAVREYVGLEDLLNEARKKDAPLLVMADEIQDPHNLGALLRVMDACGCDGLIVPKRRAVGLDATVAKTSAGAVEHVPVAKVGNLQQCLDQLKKAGYWCLGADMDGDSIYESETLERLATSPLVLVLGNEGGGVSQKLLEHCDLVLKIPMKGEINSLNVSVAGGIILFEIARQRGEWNEQQQGAVERSPQA